MCLNVCKVTRVPVRISSILCKTHSWWSPNYTPSFSAICPTVPVKQKRGAHVHLYPTLRFCKTPNQWVSKPNQISAQYVQPFPKYEKGVRTCARAAVPHSRLLQKKSCLMGLEPLTEFQRNPSSRFRDTEKGGTSALAHVRMWPTNELCIMCSYLISKRTPNSVTIGRGIP